MKKISVVVPSYNQAPYIGACLDALFFQDYPRLEIIVVDDGSTDGTADVLEAFARDVREARQSYAARYDAASGGIERVWHHRYPQAGRELTILANGENRGSTWTYNRGLRLATGEYCTFGVSDDICHPQMFSALAAPLDADEADFVYADMFLVDDAMRILREFKLPDYDFGKCFCDWYLCGVATLYRRSLHETFGYYDEGADADDHECYLRFALGGARFKHVPKTLYSVRSHEGREVGLHGRERFERLLDHSKRLVMTARQALAGRASATGGRHDR